MTTQPIDRALDDLRQGKMVILADGAHGEADLCIAAELVTPEAINFMAMHGRGLVCVSLTRERMQQVGIPLM
ncbi:MAG: 3,4-dihydroxy-2-butanone-4-phosphate synthase, partial [Candidatus Binatia bacterium]